MVGFSGIYVVEFQFQQPAWLVVCESSVGALHLNFHLHADLTARFQRPGSLCMGAFLGQQSRSVDSSHRKCAGREGPRQAPGCQVPVHKHSSVQT